MQIRRHLIAAGVMIAACSTASAESELKKGFEGALIGCEEWVLNPASWASGAEPFLETVGLGDKMGLVAEVDEAALPPPALREANHYWRINSTNDSGYILVVSDRLPMCHISGGGAEDLQPVIVDVLASDSFKARWTEVSSDRMGEMKTGQYRSIEEPAFFITISHAAEPGQRTDRVQLLATAFYQMQQ